MKVAIVGTGGVAARHLGVLAQIDSLEIVGHVSRHAERAESQAQRWGGRAHDGVEPMLDRERPDAVWVCVTPDRHGPIEETLIARGIPFFVEKPLSNDLATAERVAGLLERGPLVVGVGYKLRALDTLVPVRRLLAERPARLVVGAWHDVTPSPAWWQDERRSGGQVVEQATHLIDLARVLVGEPDVLGAVARHDARAAYPGCDVAEATAALLRFPGGVPGTLTATCLLEGHLAMHLQLASEGRAIDVSERAVRVETGLTTEEFPTSVDPFLVEDEAFVRAVRSADPTAVLCGYADALATHRVAIAIRSAAAA